MLKELNEASKKVGIWKNTAKTKTMTDTGEIQGKTKPFRASRGIYKSVKKLRLKEKIKKYKSR